jgi:hypothetical protein
MQNVDKRERILQIFDEIPEQFQEKAIEEMLVFSQFLKQKALNKLTPFLLTPSFLHEWLSEEENKAWKNL